MSFSSWYDSYFKNFYHPNSESIQRLPDSVSFVWCSIAGKGSVEFEFGFCRVGKDLPHGNFIKRRYIFSNQLFYQLEVNLVQVTSS